MMGGRNGLLVVSIVLLAIAAGCLPEPDERLQFASRPNSILIQLKHVDAPDSALAQRTALPSLTLYGDGTLILHRDGALVQIELTADAVGDVLEPIVDDGFLDFRYDAPEADASDPATYLYVQTLRAANASSAGNLDTLGDDTPKELRLLRAIIERLKSLDLAALDAAAPADYEPEAYLLIVELLDEGAGEDAQAWPFADIDLAALTSEGGLSGLEVDLEMAGAVADTIDVGEAGIATFRVGNESYRVGFRPLLPFEENFPEFDVP